MRTSKYFQVAKEKALQLERKRKAAQFLAQLAEKKTTVSSVTTDTPGTPGHESAEEGELVSADTNTHVSVTSDRDILLSIISLSTILSGDRSYHQHHSVEPRYLK